MTKKLFDPIFDEHFKVEAKHSITMANPFTKRPMVLVNAGPKYKGKAIPAFVSLEDRVVLPVEG